MASQYARKDTERICYCGTAVGISLNGKGMSGSSGVGSLSADIVCSFNLLLAEHCVHCCRLRLKCDGTRAETRFRKLRLKCDGTRAETRFRLSATRTSPFKSAGASVQSATGSRGVRISGSSAGYTMFRGSVKSTDYSLHSPVSLSHPLPCVTVCHHISTEL